MDQIPFDDTSQVSVAQGGRRPRMGHSIWWVLAAGVMALFVGLFALTLHKDAPAERNTAPVAGVVGMIADAHTAA